MFFKTGVFKNSQYYRKISVLESFFNKVASLKAYNFIKKRLRHRCFPVNIANFLGTAFCRTPLMADSGFLTKVAGDNCEGNHFSVELLSEIS